eukprot:15689-Pleurochrysis_carterae.AAC.1
MERASGHPQHSALHRSAAERTLPQIAALGLGPCIVADAVSLQLLHCYATHCSTLHLCFQLDSDPTCSRASSGAVLRPSTYS